MMEYSSPQQVADAVFGMRGMVLGERDLEARLLDRGLEVLRYRERGLARGGDDIWMCDD